MRIKILLYLFSFCSAAMSQNITANFSYTVSCFNTPTCFTDLSVSNNGAITSWDWSFGHGFFLCCTTQNPCHIFPNFGTYPVRLIVTNANGDKDTITKTITVYELPTANFSSLSDSTSVSFTDSSTSASPITTWSWSFPGASPSTANNQNPQNIIYPTGTYSVCLMVTAQNGCTDSTCQSITVNSINELSKMDFVNIFPNPFSTSTVLSVKNTQQQFSKLNFVLFDVFGKEIRNLNFLSQTLKLERENIPSGIYLYKVIGEDGKYESGKLVVVD